MWDDRVIDIWDDRLVFVLSTLFGISIWIVVAKWKEAIRAKRAPILPIILLVIFVGSVTAILAGRYFYYYEYYPEIYYNRYSTYSISIDSRFPSVGTVLSFVIGSIVGSFSARYVWRGLFSSRFGAQNPLIGALVVVLLITVYSFPVYQVQISALLSHFGLSSVKTPIAEFTFTERPQFKGSVVSSAKASISEEHSSAIPRPSYPRPGLDGLKHAVSEDEEPATEDYLIKDDRYIASFNTLSKLPAGPAQHNPIKSTRAFLRPVKTLTHCLIAYVDIIPDSQLLMVDIKPVIQFFFQMHADAVAAIAAQQIYPRDLAHDVAELRTKVEKVRLDVKDAIGGRRLSSPDFEHHFTRCSRELTPVNDQELEGFTYLQPYVTIALANLLVAHGSPDEAIDVMTQWLYLWRCARQEISEKQQHREGCDGIQPLRDAELLPEWLGIRAEFDLNVLLYQQAGEANIIYRDFLLDHTQHFAEYAAKSDISIRTELRRCDHNASAGASARSENGKPAVSTRGNPGTSEDDTSNLETRFRAVMLRSLLQNEDTLLRSELHFLASSSWVEMENLHERGLALTRFRLECIVPEVEKKEVLDLWQATLADYRITSGLLALAIADRFSTIAASADERARAEEIRNDGKQQLRDGYRQLKPVRDADRRKFSELPWRQRVFNVSRWEESCALAERAIRQLNESGP